MTSYAQKIEAVALIIAAHRATEDAMRRTRSADNLHTMFPNNADDAQGLVDAQHAQDLAFQAQGSAMFNACQILGISVHDTIQAIEELTLAHPACSGDRANECEICTA